MKELCKMVDEVDREYPAPSEFTNGPDQLIPVNNYITWTHTGAVKLHIASEGLSSKPPISVPGLLTRTAAELPNQPAMRVKDPRTNTEIVWTWSEYRDEVRTVAKAFIELGLGRFESVCILGFNSPEWSIADLAAIHAGGMAAGIYPTNGKDACKYILDNSKCKILLVEDQDQLNKVWDIRGEGGSLLKIIQYSGTPSHPGVISWKDVLNLGRSLSDEELEARLRRIAVNQACTLIYTSGTTGNPKGVMLSHDNMTFTSALACEYQHWEKGNTRVLSFLPMSHVAANMIDIHAVMYCGGTTYFADKNALKGSLRENLVWCKPTQFIGVPRVWEKIMEKMQEQGRELKGIKKSLSTSAKAAALKYHTQGIGREKYLIFQKLVFNKVKAALGLDECVYFYSGAAPLELSTYRYFLSLDIKILELYGMSETSGPASCQTMEKFRESSVGTMLPGVRSKLVQSTDPDVTGSELYLWGRNIMMGYLNREDATRKEMTEDGWMKTGDLGIIDADGFHYIVGREKDLIITSGGENVAPQPLQEDVKKELPILSNVLLLGDRQKFLSCFLTLAVDVNLDTMRPTNLLTSAARDWCRSVQSPAQTVQDVLTGPDRRVLAAIQAGIDRVNKRAVSNAQKIQKWMILPQDFSIPGGEVGPTMKVKRGEVTKKFQRSIDRIYDINMAN